MAHRKWPGKDTPVKFTTEPHMRHRGGAEALDTRHSLRRDSLRTREEASSAGKRQKTI